MADVFTILSITALVCEVALRLLPTKSDVTVLRCLRDFIDKVHQLIPNNVVTKHDKNQ